MKYQIVSIHIIVETYEGYTFDLIEEVKDILE